jgi:rubrerythrin
MDDAPSVSEDASSLDDLVESHVRRLANKLSLPHTPQEIEAEVTALNDLIHSFKHKDELLEKLLDSTATAHQRRQIRETLKAMYVMETYNGEELEQLHAKSHQLLERSIYLIAKAQRQINKEAHKYSGYSLELCGLCKGLGGSTNKPCRPCKGSGTVLVNQPARKCPQCGVEAGHANELCIICRGSGWMMTAND